ncbi:MAG: response regulator [Planctomycetes bacterium]|nr:response regulator [Planctomycetota bacterium]
MPERPCNPLPNRPAESILEVLGEGVAILHPDHRIAWVNATFEKWCTGDPIDRDFLQALGSPLITGPELPPPPTFPSQSFSTRLNRRDNNQYLDLRLTPFFDAVGHVERLVALCRDVTAEVQKQQKLDALHDAGRELASLSADQLADMNVEERVELLKQNLRKLTHDLLQYDVIEIRLLDGNTGRLDPLLAEGMMPEAAQRVLYAREQGNGVTGYVAATGKTYVCADTAGDLHYIEGAQGARSSLTIPLNWGEKVIGTFNVESPQPNAFGPEAVQFTEIFCRELSSALHTLELLLVEKRATTSQSIEAISREVALPVDEILTAATAILDRWIGHEPEMAEKLRKILAGARSIKQSIQKVGEDLIPVAGPLAAPTVETPSQLRGIRVLMVDNDERVRRSAHGLLGRLGCIVETARDGKEALTMARLSNYDAMLADIRLPDLSGIDVYRALRQAQPKARVILMTGYGYDSSHSLVKARQEGLRFILYKPFRVEQMLDALQSALQSTDARDAGAKTHEPAARKKESLIQGPDDAARKPDNARADSSSLQKVSSAADS